MAAPWVGFSGLPTHLPRWRAEHALSYPGSYVVQILTYLPWNRGGAILQYIYLSNPSLIILI